MPLTREVAESCAQESLLEIVQRGQRVDPQSYKGPIRLRLLVNNIGMDDKNINLPPLVVGTGTGGSSVTNAAASAVQTVNGDGERPGGKRPLKSSSKDDASDICSHKKFKRKK